MRARWGTRGGQRREAPSEGEQTSGRGREPGREERESERAARRLSEAPRDKTGRQKLLGGAGREEGPGERVRGERGKRVCTECARAGGRRGSQWWPGSRLLGPSGGRTACRASSSGSSLSPTLSLKVSPSHGLGCPGKGRGATQRTPKEFLVKRPNLLPPAARENRELRSRKPRSE